MDPCDRLTVPLEMGTNDYGWLSGEQTRSSCEISFDGAVDDINERSDRIYTIQKLARIWNILYKMGRIYIPYLI